MANDSFFSEPRSSWGVSWPLLPAATHEVTSLLCLLPKQTTLSPGWKWKGFDGRRQLAASETRRSACPSPRSRAGSHEPGNHRGQCVHSRPTPRLWPGAQFTCRERRGGPRVCAHYRRGTSALSAFTNNAHAFSPWCGGEHGACRPVPTAWRGRRPRGRPLRPPMAADCCPRHLPSRQRYASLETNQTLEDSDAGGERCWGRGRPSRAPQTRPRPRPLHTPVLFFAERQHVVSSEWRTKAKKRPSRAELKSFTGTRRLSRAASEGRAPVFGSLKASDPHAAYRSRRYGKGASEGSAAST